MSSLKFKTTFKFVVTGDKCKSSIPTILISIPRQMNHKWVSASYFNLSASVLTVNIYLTATIIALHTHTHTHTHTQTHPFNGPFSGATQVSRWAGARKVKPIWILLKQETVSGSGISWATCKSASCSRQVTMPVRHHSSFLQSGCPSFHPTNSVKALKA